MLTLELLAAHTPFTMLHLKTLIPTARLVAEVEACVGSDTVPLPETSDQVPEPTLGRLPDKVTVGELIQMV